MNKNSKQLGLTKPCPFCKKTIIKSIMFSGTGTFETKCPHCKVLVVITLEQKNTVVIKKVEELLSDNPAVITICAFIIVGAVMFIILGIHNHNVAQIFDPLK